VGSNCGILVFFHASWFHTRGNWIFKIKKRWEYNNENLMDFCIGTVGFWAIGYTIMYGDSMDLL
jgi:Amt family ammonium transporter